MKGSSEGKRVKKDKGGNKCLTIWGRMILCPAPPDHGKKIPNLGPHGARGAPYGAHGGPYGAHGAPWGTHGAHGPPNCKFSVPPGPGAPWAPGALGFGAHWSLEPFGLKLICNLDPFAHMSNNLFDITHT